MIARTALLAACAVAFGAAQAQTKWDMPTPYSEGEFHTRNVKAFAEDVKKATGGKLDITVHSNGSLIKHPDILRAVSTGQVNIAEFLLGQFGNEDPVFAADNVPFVAPGYDDAFKFYQAQKPVLEKKLQGRGLKLLYAVAWPGQGIYTKDPLKIVTDLKGTEVAHLQPAYRAARRAARREPDRGAGARGAADVRHRRDAGDGHLLGHRHRDQGLGVRQELHQDQRLESEERRGGERARLQPPAEEQQNALIKAAAAAEPRGWEMSKAREKEGDERWRRTESRLRAYPRAEAALAKIGEQMAAEWEKSAGADGQAILKAYRSK